MIANMQICPKTKPIKAINKKQAKNNTPDIRGIYYRKESVCLKS